MGPPLPPYPCTALLSEVHSEDWTYYCKNKRPIIYIFFNNFPGSSTSNQFPFYQEHILDDQHDTMSDPTLYGSSSLTRSGTVKRAGTNFLQKKESSEVIKSFSMYEDSDSVFIKEKSSPDSVNSRYRRSLDSTFR